MKERQSRSLIEALVASAGMVLFALLAHQGLPWIIAAALGLLATAVAIERSFHPTSRPLTLLGLSKFSLRTALLAPAGCAVGAGFAVIYRIWCGMSALPSEGLQAFVVFACLIGATEELLYRGWVQGRLRMLEWPAAVVLAAVAHAAYKTALFAWPPSAMAIDHSSLALWTAVGGAVFGLLKESAGSVTVPMIGHAAFDLMAYGAVAHAPWWVWT